MSTLASIHDAALINRETPAERTAPERKRRGQPVLMHDCVTPVAGTTMLHALWRRWDAERDEDHS